MKNLLFICGMMLGLAVNAQVSGIMRGQVVELESQFPIPMAFLEITGNGITQSVSADLGGNFEFAEIPVGRYKLTASAIGYRAWAQENIIINSGKVRMVQVQLEESVLDVGTAEVRAESRPGGVMNEMATVSAQQFTVAETDRYAGSRGDPARMASNFAGVQGADDSRNDIVVRGNSPAGVLWRVEGVDIPNPNHFAIPGTAGGPVAILNNKFLANSEFYTGAFPAEFGNSTAGVFNLRLRNGNRQENEFSAQLGFLGTELLGEGPINREKGHSFLAMYRYSTVELFSLLGIDIGTSAVPRYQDGAFKVNFLGKDGSSLSLWGFGGVSSVDILISDQISPERNIFGENDRDQYFKSRMMLAGATWSHPFSRDTYVKTTLAHGIDWQDSWHERVFRQLGSDGLYVLDSLRPLMTYTYRQDKTTLSSSLNHKFNRNWTLRAGVIVDFLQWNFTDSIQNLNPDVPEYGTWNRRWDADEESFFIQSFAQIKWRPDDHWTVVAGLHNQSLTFNESHSWLEPRLGISRQLKAGQRLSLGLGVHSQMQPGYLLFYGTDLDDAGNIIPNNRDLGFSRSRHVVLGYERPVGEHLYFKAETYFQQLYDIPVEIEESSFSLINAGSGFTRFFPDSLQNSGAGRNYGLELTLSRAFTRGWFFLISASVFDAKYEGSDGVLRNVEFNGRYAWNILGSREWKLKPGVSLVTGAKLTSLGGRWYGPVDIDASNEAREIVWVDEERNSLQFDPYFRADLKVNLTFNRPQTTHEVGIDFVNITGRENILKLTYAPDENENPEESIREEYQLGFLPIFFYRVDF